MSTNYIMEEELLLLSNQTDYPQYSKQLTNARMFQLSEAEKITVLSVCIGLLALTILITVCVVSPTCWLHVCIKNFTKRRKLKYQNAADALEEGTYINLKGSPQYTVECGPPNTYSNSKSNSLHGRKREDSTYSSMSSSSQGNASVSNYSEASVDAPTTDAEQDTNYGQVTFSAWCCLPDGANMGKLIVILKEAQDILPRSYGGACDPYLILQLVRNSNRRKWSKPNTTLIYEFRTSSKKKTQHPIFKEKFSMDISKTDYKEGSLKIAVYDDEKYANDSQLGEVAIPLRELNLDKNGEEISKTLDFLAPQKEHGELLFGLSYLPTAERLTFTITKAQNLRMIADDIDSFGPFIRILLLYNGKVVKKKKTTSREATTNPIFNETLTFDVPPSQLDHVVFLVVASDRFSQDLSSPESPTTPPRKSRHIGKVVVGSCIKSGPAFHHWKAMKQSPRKQVTQWHRLR